MVYAIIRPRLLPLLLLAAFTLSMAATPAHARQPNPNPSATWAAWGLDVRFPDGALKVSYGAYVGDDSPPKVLEKLVENITKDCVVQGDPLIVDAAGYARFNGNSYIECNLPNWHAKIAELAPHLRPAQTPVACECKSASPFWVSGDFTLDAVSGEQPIFDALGLDVDMLSNQLSPTTLGTRVRVDGRWVGPYLSPVWTTTNTTPNRLLVGEEGPIAVVTIDSFGGLPYMTNPAWRPYFNANMRGTRVGLWREPAGTGSWTNLVDPGFNMNTAPATVYIGYDPNTATYLRGSLNTLRIDPGCRAD